MFQNNNPKNIRMMANEKSHAKLGKTNHHENSKKSAVHFANAVTVPSASWSDWIARKGPYSLFEVLMRMLPEVRTIYQTEFDGKVLILSRNQETETKIGCREGKRAQRGITSFNKSLESSGDFVPTRTRQRGLSRWGRRS